MATEAQLRYIISVQDRDLQKLKKEVRELNKEMGKAGAEGAGGWTQRMESAGKAMEKTGKRATTHLSLPIVAAGALSVKAFADFDSAMNESLAIMGKVGPGLRKEMEQTARATAKELGMPAAEAAGSYLNLVSAGYEAQAAVAAMPQVARFAKAGMMQMGDAVSYAAAAQSALGLKSKDPAKNLAQLTRITDVLTKANIAADGEVEDFAKALTNKAGPALRLVGKDIEEGTAVLAAFASQGLKGEAAGEALSIVTRDLQNAAIKNAAEFRKMNVSVFDASGEMRNYADIIGDLERALDGKSDAEKRQILSMLGFQDKSVANLLTLVGTSKEIRNYERELRNAGGATKEVADKQMRSFASQMAVAKANVMDAAISLGQILGPTVLRLTQWLAGAIGVFAALPAPIQSTLVVVLALTAAIGPLLLVSGKLIGYIIATKQGTTALAFAIRGLGVAFAFLAANPVVLAIAALVALGVALVVAYRNSETFRAFVHDAFDKVKAAAAAFADFFTRTLPAALSRVKTWVASYWPEIATLISGPFALVVALATDAFGLRSALVNAFNAIIRLAQDAGVRIVNGVLSGLVNLGGAVKQRIEAELRFALSSLNPFSPVEHGGRKFIADPIIKGTLDGLSAMKAKMGDKLSEGVREAVESAKGNLRSISAGLASSISGVIDAELDRTLKVIDSRFSTALAGLDGSPMARQLAEMDAQMKATSDARELYTLEHGLAQAQTGGDPEEIAAARQRLDDYLLKQQRDALAARLTAERDALVRQQADERKAAEDGAKARKETLERGLRDLTDSYTRGEISTATYQARLTKIIGRNAPEWRSAGELLGSEFANRLNDQMTGALRQSNALKALGAGMKDLTGASVKVIQPLAVMADELAQKAKEAADALGSKGSGKGATGAGEAFTGSMSEAAVEVANVNQKIADLDPVPATTFGFNVKGAFSSVVDFARGNWGEIQTILQAPFAPLVALAYDAFGVRSGLTDALVTLKGEAQTKAGELISAVWTKITSTAASVFGFPRLLFDRLIQPMVDKVTEVVEKAADLSRAVPRGIASVTWDMAGILADKVITPLTNFITGSGPNSLVGKAEAIGEAIWQGIKDGAAGIINTVGTKFTSFANGIIGLVNKIPFVPDIGRLEWTALAEGGILRGPTFAVVGEDGPEAVIPLGRKRRKRGQQLMTQAARIMGMQGEGPGPNVSNVNRGIPFLADGAIVIPNAWRTASLDSMLLSTLKSQNNDGILEKAAGFLAGGAGALIGRLPMPNTGNAIFDAVGRGVRDAAKDAISNAFSSVERMNVEGISKALTWSKAQMGKPYVWGGGHAGWDFNLGGYDCSGFASHAAKMAGAALGSPGTTSATLGVAQRGAVGPVMWGWRGMDSSDPRTQHMGAKVLSQWYQFGDPGKSGGADSQWRILGVPPGLPTYLTGGPVNATGPALLHGGEEVLSRREAAAFRAGGAGPLVHIEHMHVREVTDPDLIAGALSRKLATLPG